MTGAHLDFLRTAFVAFGMIRTLLHAAHNTLDGVICFHLDIPILSARILKSCQHLRANTDDYVICIPAKMKIIQRI